MASDYCDRSDIEDLFGTVNVEKWGDLNNTKVPAEIAARIARAISTSSDDMDDQLRQGPYLIPVVTAAGTTPGTIVDICAKLAGVWLYEARGTEDSKGIHRLSSVKGEAHLALANIRTGKTRIDSL